MKTVLFAWLIIGCAEPGEPECVGDECGPHTTVFELGASQRIAAGTEYTYSRTSAVPSDVAITSSDPSIVEVSVNEREVTLTSHRAGKVVLTATARNQPLDTVDVTSAAVQTIDVFYRATPGDNAPVASFAAIVGQIDEICVTYRDAAGRPLAGMGQFALSNDGIELLGVGPSSRRSEDFAQPSRSTCVGLGFRSVGATSLIATVGDLSTSTPITVDVTPPASSQLSVMALHDWSLQMVTEVLDADDIGGANVISKAADGRYVLGVDTTWMVVGATPLFIGTHEVAFTPAGAGPIEITATSAGVTMTRTVWIGS
jgi:hypothetical protein